MSIVLDFRGEIFGRIVNENGTLKVMNPANGSMVYLITNIDPASSSPYDRIVIERASQADNESFLKSVDFASVYALPANPWEGGAGGSIYLKSPMSVQQLLDGELHVMIKQNGISSNGRFYQSQDAITIMSGGNTVFGVTLSPSQDAATELILGYIYTDNSFNLESVY